ncbi:MAG: hypothetical protein HC769_03090 [Cyanobacteria bacterium CRU_2_1]|nr:hypothetical protein [Cyanobacteria bacterium RU_5_0]NJR57920.1 hypothetical protein [Cyanobacteria bacterium CRU_2_1]
MDIDTQARQATQAKIEAQLEEFHAQIGKLKAKATQARTDAKIKCHEQIEILTVKHQQAQSKLREMRVASNSAWQEIEVGAEKALHDLQAAFDKATSHFK